MQTHSEDPLHGKTLEVIMTYLVEKYGWEELAKRIPVKCFMNHPSVSSSLTFLRKTSWAREKVERLYVATAFPYYAPRFEGKPLDLEL